ncbi:MAG: cysteine synthase family protein [Chloroflexi bacterium]|nr:cysteine synthase family protein [Chloroflexota bacterium]
MTSRVGNTPLLPLLKIGRELPEGVKLYAKAEWFNPGGSVKDRPALNILRRAIEEGHLRSGVRLLDSTSGNMGISYATFANALDIPVTLTMPANASRERMVLLRALGAELILTDPTEGSDGALREARRLAKDTERYYYANQYDNPANWQAHYLTTGPEIAHQSGGEITHFVAGLGTTGTLVGTGRYLKEYNPAIQIVAVQPDSAFHGLEGLKHMPTAIRPAIFDAGLADQTVTVDTESAYTMVKRLAREEGLLVGISSGAAAAAALNIAVELNVGVVVTIFPDSAYKYLSDHFWEG